MAGVRAASTPLIVTAGEPAGIGPDLCVKLAHVHTGDPPLVILANRELLAARAALLNLPFDVPDYQPGVPAPLSLMDLPLAMPATPGQPNTANSGYVLAGLRRAVEGCMSGEFAGLVTGPVHKGVINAAGIPFTGHTEYLAELTATARSLSDLSDRSEPGGRARTVLASAETRRLVLHDFEAHSGTMQREIGEKWTAYPTGAVDQSQVRQAPRVVMMLVGECRLPRLGHDASFPLRVALATTHLPLRQVADAITPDGLTQTLRILVDGLKRDFGIPRPRILVAGLNPHAGEGGHLGREEIEVIEPVLVRLRGQGMELKGPLPADTLFQPGFLLEADAVLAMYHDQGLPVLKHASFGEGVNVTLGLPIVRTSVDHGTALELAGTGRAQAGSLLAAIRLAAAIVRQRSLQRAA